MKTMYPRIMEFNPGTRCRLNCSICYRQGKTYQNPRKILGEDQLKQLIIDFSDSGGQELYISGGLEPFLRYETVCHSLLLANKNKLQTRIYTNGTEACLQKRWIQELIVSTTTQVRLSIHAISPSVYSKVTGVSNCESLLNQVIENTKSLVDLSTKLGPKIGIGYVVNQYNASELSKAAHFWRDLGVHFMDVRFDVMASNRKNTEYAKEIKAFQKHVKNNYLAPMQVQVGDFANNRPELAEKCFSPYHKIVVDPYGYVWSCCLQAQPGMQPSWACLGDLTKHTYGEIIQNIRSSFPRKHCTLCTPYEIQMNLKMSQRYAEYTPETPLCMTTTELKDRCVA